MSRRDIYYWKCDRSAAFHGTQSRGETDANLASELEMELCRHFDTKNVVLSPGAGQGNHLTWNADVDGKPLFIRVENGPEKDAHLAVESALLDRVRAAGVATPRVFGCDATRSRVSFAWQALERIEAPDLNQWFKQGTLEVPKIAFEIGVAVAKWQAIRFDGFGIFEWSAQSPVRLEGLATLEPHRGLCGPHSAYADYFHLRLDEHLRFLTERGFLANADEIRVEIENHRALLELPQGCLVHKDLALWNILGTRDQIAAFIDFDDSIAGDSLDDLSLLACFHDAAFLRRAFDGYESVRSLPEHHLRRFWLHLLRNMIVKAVIRVGAGYFDRDDGFFLIGSGSSGASLREITLSRLSTALRSLREGSGLDILSPMKTHIGTFLSIGSPAVTELAAEVGFDWVLIDLEHGCESEAALPNQLRALRGSNTLAIVRVSAPHPDLISRVLDWGADGLMVPHVDTVAQAQHCVDAANYPPKGHRGVSRTVRAYGYGMRLPTGEMPKPIILAQIETADAVTNADQIAALEGIDALFIGPADLSYDLKARNSPLLYDDCVNAIAKAAKDHGKGCGILVRHADDKEKLKALGFTWIAMDSDLSLVREGFKRNIEMARTWC